MPLGTIYRHEIEPSRKETRPTPKGLEHVQIVIDTDKFHNVLFFEKEQGTHLNSPVAGFHCVLKE